MIEAFGYFGVAGLIALENIFPPIPSEVILPFSGFLTTCTTLRFPYMVAASTAGSLIGAILLYLLGRIFSFEKICRLLSGKCGKALHLPPENVNKALLFFEKKGNSAVFFCRFIPIVRSLISIPAGCAKMPFVPFLLLTVAGSFLWNTALTYLGARMGESWDTISRLFHAYSEIILLAALVLLLSVLFFKWILPCCKRHFL